MNNSWQRHSERMTYQRFKYPMVILFLLAAFAWSPAQVVSPPLQQLSADQLLQYYRSLKDSSQQGVLLNELYNGKCGLGLNAVIHSQWNNFTGLQKIEFKKLLGASPSQKNRIVGKFHIYYDTTGANEPALLDASNQRIPNTAEEYIDSLVRIFNDVYHVEIELLGYAAPPPESGETCYRIFVSDMSNYPSGTYGSTDWDQSLPPLNSDGSAPRYPCFVELHNDFSVFKTKGMDALKVTAAHEFHHVIQVGSYGYRSNDIYFYEITSTWMEDVNYTDVNDYYNYLQNYFSFFSRGLSFNYYDMYHGGYERCIWAHYLAKRFNPDIMRDVWTRMRTKPFLESIDAALTGIGSNLQTAFAEFTYWNYFTADRADKVKYYSEGDHYPRFQPLQKIGYVTGNVTIGGDVSPFSSSLYEFGIPNDTITAIIANVDVNSARNYITTSQRVDITLFSSENVPPRYHQFENGLKAQMTVADTSLWHDFYSRSSTLIYDLRQLSNLAPNPFRVNTNQQLFLPVNKDEDGLANVYLYSSSFSLVYNAEIKIKYLNRSMVIAISGPDFKSKLSSGVYFVFAKTKKRDYQWKMSVIR